MTQPHRMAAAIPRIEVADHRHAPRIRRPYGKAHARHAVHFHRARAEAFEYCVRVAAGETAQRLVAENGAERIRILDFLHGAMPVDAQAIGRGRRDAAGKQPGPELLEFAERCAVGA
jgi:hypothetical protein